jgi:RNA polymerase sigma-70 factor (ECF subfamily)
VETDPAGPRELMERYCEGDQAAFTALYALVAPRLLAYLVGLVQDRAAAEDLLQQTFIKLHHFRDQYVRAADPLPWLYTPSPTAPASTSCAGAGAPGSSSPAATNRCPR